MAGAPRRGVAAVFDQTARCVQSTEAAGHRVQNVALPFIKSVGTSPAATRMGWLVSIGWACLRPKFYLRPSRRREHLESIRPNGKKGFESLGSLYRPEDERLPGDQFLCLEEEKKDAIPPKGRTPVKSRITFFLLFWTEEAVVDFS